VEQFGAGSGSEVVKALPELLLDLLGTGRARQRHGLSGIGVVLPAYLDHVDRPRESGLIGVRWVTTADEHAPRCIEPALDVVVHVLAAHDSSPPSR
jgi:hypothetical protein